MRLDAKYTVVFELDYPLGESSDLAYDTWARDLQDKVCAQFTVIKGFRAVRQGGHLKFSLAAGDWATALRTMVTTARIVAPQIPDNMSIQIHQHGVEPAAPAETIPLEEINA